jgi:hypothetical protein
MMADRPLDGDRDRAVAPVATRGPAPRGAGNREVGLLVAAVAAAPNASQRGDCRAYSPGTHARKEEDGLLLEFPYNPTRTRSV